MEKYEILTDYLSRFYRGDYKSIKRIKKEDSETETYRVNFGWREMLVVNNVENCIYLNIVFDEANALEFLSDVMKQHETNRRKERYEKAKEMFLKAQEELAQIEGELEEECN